MPVCAWSSSRWRLGPQVAQPVRDLSSSFPAVTCLPDTPAPCSSTPTCATHAELALERVLCDASNVNYDERIQDAFREGRLSAMPEAQWQKLSHSQSASYAYVAPPTLAAGWLVSGRWHRIGIGRCAEDNKCAPRKTRSIRALPVHSHHAPEETHPCS